MITNAIERNEKGTNLSVSESFLFRSFCNFEEIVPAVFLLEKRYFVPFSFLFLRKAFLEFLGSDLFLREYGIKIVKILSCPVNRGMIVCETDHISRN